MTSAIEKISAGQKDERVPVSGSDELSRMAVCFNEMCDALDLSYRQIEQEQNKLTTIILSAREGIVVTDKDESVVLVNPAAERLLDKSSDTIRQSGFSQLIDDPDYIAGFLASGGTDMPETVVYNNRVLNFYAATIRHESGNLMGSAALIRDVTEEKRLEEKLRQLSSTDGLTGLINRRRMDEILDEELQRARRYKTELAFLLFDVDHFKKFNDTHGHDQGDRVLQALAKAMKSHFRNVDFCCRYGGEEFTVILPHSDAHNAQTAAERFRIRVESMLVDGLQVTISIGVSLYPLINVEKPSELIKAADLALYEAKHQGRNQVCMAPDSQ